MTFTFATQIQPRDGRELSEYPNGVELIGCRVWSEKNRRQFHEAQRSLTDGFMLITDDQNLAYSVLRAEFEAQKN